MKKIYKIIRKINLTRIIEKSIFFDKEWYEKTYNINKNDAAKHFLNIGYLQGYDPSISFSCNTYAQNNRDIGLMNPLLHYELYGKNEGRLPPKYYNNMQKQEEIIEEEIFEEDTVEHNIINLNYRYEQINIKSMLDVFRSMNCEVFCNFKLPENQKYVAVFTNELNLTEPSIALNKLIIEIKKIGYCPVILSQRSGMLKECFINNQVIFIVYNDIDIEEIFEQYLSLFSLAIVNNCSDNVINIIKRLNGKNIEVIWWIHEVYTIYQKKLLNTMPEYLFNNINVYCIGTYIEKKLKECRPNYKTNILPYCLDDLKCSEKKRNTKKNFLIIGTLEPRNGHTVLLNAIEKMDDDERDKCSFTFVGAIDKKNLFIYERLKELIVKYPENIKFYNVLSKEEIKKMYQKTDCLLCCSMDETMPIVVTEAWQNKVFTICSEYIGQSDFIRDEQCGLIYKNNDCDELKNCIVQFLNEDIETQQYINNAYKIYEKEFSEARFHINVKKIIEELEDKQKGNEKKYEDLVSIIIPVFNGGQDIINLLSMLKKQKNVNFEIICVDSGSTDGSVDVIKKYGCELIEISNKDFSHSYARNLGAEHAKGKYLLFMTQDPVIEGEKWLYNFLKYMIETDVDAASINSKYNPAHNLFGKFEVWGYMNNIGINHYNRIITLSATEDFEELRRKAGLSDVTCMHKKAVFDKFKYFGTFAEDFDYGIRLLKAGYKIGLFSSLSMIHSHERKQYYHFKRALIDYMTFENIRKKYGYETDDKLNINVDNNILSLYIFVIYTIENLVKSKYLIHDFNSYMRFVIKNKNEIFNRIKNLNNTEIYNIFTIKTKYIDEEIYDIFKKVFLENIPDFTLEYIVIEEFFNHLYYDLPAFFRNNNECFVNGFTNEMINFITRMLSAKTGLYLTSNNIKSYTLKKIKEEIIKNSGI